MPGGVEVEEYPKEREQVMRDWILNTIAEKYLITINREEIDSEFGGNSRLFIKVRDEKFHARKVGDSERWRAGHKDEVVMRINGIKELPPGGYWGVFKKQDGRCKLCGKEEHVCLNGKIKDLATDHNPKTKKFRGLLCQDCNLNRVSCIDQIVHKMSSHQTVQILLYIGIKTLLRKIDVVCDSNLLNLYLVKNRQNSYRRKFPDRKIKWREKNINNSHISSGDRCLLMKDQNGRCKLCRQKETMKGSNGKVRALSVDHSHRTNIVRGLLCNSCNTKVRYIDQILDMTDLSLLGKIIRYVGRESMVDKLKLAVTYGLSIEILFR